MKHFDLMALYYPEACIKSEEGRYIEIRSVKNYKEYRLCRTKGNVNLTDYWFAMADAGKRQPLAYGCQFISMISDEEQAENSWTSGHEGQEICCAFFKFRLEELNEKFRLEEANISVQDIKNLISGALNNYKDEPADIIEYKWFYTIDNADAILVFFSDDKVKIQKAVKRIKNVKYMVNEEGREKEEKQREESVYYSDYYVTGRCEKLRKEDEREDQKADQEAGFMIKDFSIENGNALPQRQIREDGWCEQTLTILQKCIGEYEKGKNKKMVAYYQALGQIVNVLSQYEQENPLKDYFYIFYPSIVLFIKQLNQSIALLNDSGKEGDECDDPIKIKYEKMQVLESGISEFIDTIEMLMRHMGQSCSDMLSDLGRQGLPYDIPLRLCLMYMSYLNVLTSYLNDTEYEYQFCLAPLVYSRPTTNYIDLGLPPGDRLIRIRLSRHCMFMPRSLLIILSHEALHYIISDEQRIIRAKYYIPVIALVLTYEIVPYHLLRDCRIESMDEKAILEKYLEIVRRHIMKYAEKFLKDQVFSQKEDPCAFHLSQVFERVKIGCLAMVYDAKNELRRCITQIDSQTIRALNALNVPEKLIRKIYIVQEQIIKQCERIWQEDHFNQNMANITTLFREIYPDLGTVMLLDLSPVDYLEAILISESYDPDPDIISDVLVTRVAILKMVMEDGSEANDWKKKWNDISREDLNQNQFLIELKKKVEQVCVKFTENAKEADGNESDVQEGGIMYCLQILKFEKEYLKKCKKFLGEKIGGKSKKRDILLALFRQFAVYEKAEEEDPSAQDMFKALDELIFCCKKDIKDAYDR